MEGAGLATASDSGLAQEWLAAIEPPASGKALAELTWTWVPRWR